MNMKYVISIMAAVFASTGFWEFIIHIMQSHRAKNTIEREMLMGLGHDRICYLGERYLKRGYITKHEYENLHDHLFLPYLKMKGNGLVKKIMKEVDKLPMREGE